MKHVAGLDFGTTNSAIGYSDGIKSKLVNLGNKTYTRTAMFFAEDEREYYFGDEALDIFKEGEVGRLFTSVKSFLNTKEEIITLLGFRPTKLTTITSMIISNLKKQLEKTLNEEVDSVTVGRPVKFHDTNEEQDKLAQKRLESALTQAGFKNIKFLLEPLAVVESYQEQTTSEETILIIDLGGGTSDFSIVKVKPGEDTSEILSNNGTYIGGNDIDKIFSLKHFSKYLGKGAEYEDELGRRSHIPHLYYSLLSDFRRLKELGTYDNKHSISRLHKRCNIEDKEKIKLLLDISNNTELGYLYLDLIEAIKIKLSQKDITKGTINISNVQIPFNININDFNLTINDIIENLNKTILETLKLAQLDAKNIDKVVMSGGTSLNQAIIQLITKMFGGQKIASIDNFNSIGYGLTKHAGKIFI